MQYVTEDSSFRTNMDRFPRKNDSLENHSTLYGTGTTVCALCTGPLFRPGPRAARSLQISNGTMRWRESSSWQWDTRPAVAAEVYSGLTVWAFYLWSVVSRWTGRCSSPVRMSIVTCYVDLYLCLLLHTQGSTRRTRWIPIVTRSVAATRTARSSITHQPCAVAERSRAELTGEQLAVQLFPSIQRTDSYWTMVRGIGTFPSLDVVP